MSSFHQKAPPAKRIRVHDEPSASSTRQPAAAARPSTTKSIPDKAHSKRHKDAEEEEEDEYSSEQEVKDSQSGSDEEGVDEDDSEGASGEDNGEEAEGSGASGSGDDDEVDVDEEEEAALTAAVMGKPAAATAAAAGGAGASAAGEAEAAEPPVAKTFAELGVCEALCEATAAVGWSAPTKIQVEAVPVGLAGKDIIGLAETGSGKTGAFALPILQALLENPQRLFALVLAPTRELAFQIAEQFEALGSSIGLKTTVVVGGVDMMTQAISLARKPHVVIGTPGRIVDHLENTKGFSLRSIKYLVLDEADRMLSLDFEEAINTILAALPRERYTYLFSATMTSKVAKLQRASLRDPVRVEVSNKYNTVSTLVQQYIFLPAKYKETYLVYVLNEFSGQSSIVFLSTCAAAQRTTLMLQNLGFGAACLHGQMTQSKRLGALNKFKAGSKTILVATDVASRGLDIPAVDMVVNYDVPSNGKDYIHRVGRTARAGRSGRALTFVTQYDIELYQRIEHLLGRKLEAFPIVEEAAIMLATRVGEAQRLAAVEMREMEDGEAGGGGGGFAGSKRKASALDDGENEDGVAAGIVADSMRRRASIGASIRGAANHGTRGGSTRGRGGSSRGGGGFGGSRGGRGSGGSRGGSRGGGRGRGGGGGRGRR